MATGDKNDKRKMKRKVHSDFMLGNNFWERRTTHGRDKIFADPQTMWNAAVEYFQDTINHPLYSMEAVGGKLTRVPKVHAFTLNGLTLFLGVGINYFNQFDKAINEKLLADPDGKADPEAYKINNDFSLIIQQIKQTIYQQKFTASAAGQLNANIISRELGLMDKREIDHKNNGDSFKANQVTVFRIPHNNRDEKPDSTNIEPEKHGTE